MKATSLELSPMLTQMPGGAEAALGIQSQGLKLGVEPESDQRKREGKGVLGCGQLQLPLGQHCESWVLDSELCLRDVVGDKAK